MSLVERSTLSETPLAKPLKTRAGADALVEHEARDELDEDDGVDGALGQGPGVAAGVDPVVGRPRRVVVDLADLEGDVVLRARQRVVRDARVVVREHVRDDDVAAQPDDEVGQRVRRLEAREAEDGHELRVRLAREVREDHRHERERRHEEDAAEALAPPLVEVDRAPDGAEVRALPAQDAVPVDEVRDEPAERAAEHAADDDRDESDERLGSKRVIQRRFNVSVPPARIPNKTSTRRDRSER